MTATTNSTAYGYVNTRHHALKAEGDTHWFATRQKRDAAMVARRGRAVRDGIAEPSARAGIYPVKARMTDAIADKLDEG